MNIKLYNTASRSIEEFVPIDENEIHVYSCGPTVYHYAHLGNMRAYVFADILQRTLKTKYAKVKHVINITDVGHLVSDGDTGEDKLEKGSAREGKSVWDVAQFYTDAFMSDLERLNIDKNNFLFPRATDYIAEQVAIVKALEDKGYTYTTNDGVYFDTSKWDKYADFAKLKTDSLNAGERVDMGEKKHATDFALWKFSPKNEQRQMEWESPWGVGFPGWHIECSAMSEALLGKHFDIHTGGIDHIPVHHTNEIAQSECAHNGERFVNYWCHVNFLTDKIGKMSKSGGDFLRLQTLIDAGYNAEAYRYLLLQTHYRKEVEFSYESLDAAVQGLVTLRKKYNKYKLASADNGQDSDFDTWDKFLSALYNDLNTAKALAVIHSSTNYKDIERMCEVLGIKI